MLIKLLKGKVDDMPAEANNWRLWYGVFVFGLMGAARGLDEGLIGTASTLIPFKTIFGLDKGTTKQQAARLGNITGMVQLGSIVGAVFGFWVADKLGRVWAT